MKIQKISSNLQTTNPNSLPVSQKKKTMHNNSNPIMSSTDLAFMGSKLDLIKGLFKPATKNLDDAMMVGIKELNISPAMTRRLTPKSQASTYAEIVMAKINATEKRIKDLEETIRTQAKPKRVVEAEDDLNFYYSWDDAAQEAKHRARAEKARKAERDKYWTGLKWLSDGDEKYDIEMEPYWKGSGRHWRIENNLEEIRSIINDHNISINAQRETLEALKREKASYMAELQSAYLEDVVNLTLNQRGGINQRIAGYDKVKMQIRQHFVTPLLDTKKNPTISLPNAVVLYGATGVGKTEMLRGIEHDCANVANIVHFPMDTPIDGFMKKIKELLTEARQRYIKDTKRTILLIDEAEKYMCMSSEKANRLASSFEADDFDVLERYGKYDKENIDFLKSLLDRISEVPNPDNPKSTQSATTLFITTNYPHLIDQDLMRRKGKFLPIAVKPAADEDLKAVIKHYFQQNSLLLERTKAAAQNDNFTEIINGQVRFSPKAKKLLIEKRNNGTLNNMSIDPELSDWPNLERFIQFMNPSDKRGAYSNVEIQFMIREAFERYIENPSKPMYKYFFEVKDETLRDITPLRYSKFKMIYKMVNDKVDTEDLGKAQKEFADLIHAYQNGELNDEMCKAVEKQMKHIQAELEKLEELRKKGIKLSESEQKQYDLFKMWYDMWE